MKAPPLLPEETLHRVLRVANFNGLSVLALSGMLALAVASTGNYNGAAFALLVAASGAMELHGAGLLRAGEVRGSRWLIASQPYLLVIMVGYCVIRLLSYDPELLRAAMTGELRAALAQAGYEEERFLRLVYLTTYAVLAIGTLIYQGFMTAYYVRRRPAVTAALAADVGAERFN
jgi:hypothetical protein